MTVQSNNNNNNNNSSKNIFFNINKINGNEFNESKIKFQLVLSIQRATHKNFNLKMEKIINTFH